MPASHCNGNSFGEYRDGGQFAAPPRKTGAADNALRQTESRAFATPAGYNVPVKKNRYGKPDPQSVQTELHGSNGSGNLKTEYAG